MEALERAPVASGRASRRIIFMFCNFVTCVAKKENQNRGSQMNSPTFPQKSLKFFATSPVPVRRSGQAFIIVPSLHFVPGVQSAVCSLHFVLTGLVLLFLFERKLSPDQNIGARKKNLVRLSWPL